MSVEERVSKQLDQDVKKLASQAKELEEIFEIARSETDSSEIDSEIQRDESNWEKFISMTGKLEKQIMALADGGVELEEEQINVRNLHREILQISETAREITERQIIGKEDNISIPIALLGEAQSKKANGKVDKAEDLKAKASAAVDEVLRILELCEVLCRTEQKGETELEKLNTENFSGKGEVPKQELIDERENLKNTAVNLKSARKQIEKKASGI